MSKSGGHGRVLFASAAGLYPLFTVLSISLDFQDGWIQWPGANSGGGWAPAPCARLLQWWLTPVHPSSQGSSHLRFSFADSQRDCSGIALPVVSRLTFSRVLHIAGGSVLLLKPSEGVRDHCQLSIFSCLPSPTSALGKALGLLVLMCLWHVQGAAGRLSLSQGCRALCACVSKPCLMVEFVKVSVHSLDFSLLSWGHVCHC